MIKSFDVLPKEVRGKGALLSFVNEDVPLSSNVSAVPFFLSLTLQIGGSRT